MNASIQAAPLKVDPELGTHDKFPRGGRILAEQYRKGKMVHEVLLQLGL